jgi:hypothetical protein
MVMVLLLQLRHCRGGLNGGQASVLYNFFPSPPAVEQNKLECLSVASLFILVKIVSSKVGAYPSMYTTRIGSSLTRP